MKFSIIVPVYNAEKFLDKLVQSVLRQSYQEYELILVDDSSKDESYKLMKQYEAQNHKIKAYTKNNTGPGMTRRYGFEKSTGDLLFFVDADDWITEPDVLARINTIFEKNPNIDILFFDREDVVGNKKDIIPGFEKLDVGVHKLDEIEEVIRPGLGAKILKRDILIPEMFYESTIFEDLYTTYAYLEKCDKFYYCPSCFYTIYHDENSNSLSSTETAEDFSKSLDMILKIYYRTNRPALKYSLELRMATLFTHYWKNKIFKKSIIDSSVEKYMRLIVEILKKNKIIIIPNENSRVKIIIYRFLLIISGGNNE